MRRGIEVAEDSRLLEQLGHVAASAGPACQAAWLDAHAACGFDPGALLPALLRAPEPIADTYWGEPGISSLKYASELHIGKTATDVVLNGHAWGAGGRAVTQSMVSLRVAERHKVVKVFGDRTWRGSGFSAPQPFEKLPLVYERAFGGSHLANDRVVSAEERNPVGVGYAGKRSASDMAGQQNTP